ncbi:MAG: HAD family hydrolase [Candidatus Tectomicrobia bacterium]|nr:HAD family hydrolase [Candidatus Tectomicrobia bacterium]
MNSQRVVGQELRAIIFDFDGVILESNSIKTSAFLELFASYPEHQPAILRYHLENLGVSRHAKFAWIYRELLRRELSAAEGEALGERFSALVLDKLLRCPFVPGACETLDALYSRCLLFVASGTPEEELRFIIEERRLGKFFSGVWGAPRGKVEIVETILRDFALQPREALFIGDGVSDYQAALRSGVAFVARDTPEQHEAWRELGVPVLPDLTEVGRFAGLTAH